jgi:hypothetical protein
MNRCLDIFSPFADTVGAAAAAGAETAGGVVTGTGLRQ